MPRAIKRQDLIMQRVSFDLPKGGGHINGVIIQAFERNPNHVDVQVKLDGTGELRWFYIKRKAEKSELPNAPREQTCDQCGRRAKRIHKGNQVATYRCSAGHQMIITIKKGETDGVRA